MFAVLPNKVNPAQCEALTIIGVQVMANDRRFGVCDMQ